MLKTEASFLNQNNFLKINMEIFETLKSFSFRQFSFPI